MTQPTLQLRRPQYHHPYGFELATVNPDVVVEILDYLFNTTAWKSNPDLIKRKVTQTRLRLFDGGPGTLSDGITRQRNDSLFAGVSPIMHAELSKLGADAYSPLDTSVDEADEVDDENAWIERGIALRMEGAGWTRLTKELGKPRATLRRVIAKAMDERGLVAPVEDTNAD